MNNILENRKSSEGGPLSKSHQSGQITLKGKPVCKIHFVRHGEVDNPNKILYGRLPNFHLNQKGHRQARLAAEYLKDSQISMIYSSPMPRAIETASVIASECELRIETSELLNEIHSPYEGLPLEQVWALTVDKYEDLPPEYENPEDIVARLQQFGKLVRAKYRGHSVIAISHGDVILFARMMAENIPLGRSNRKRYSKYPTQGSVTTFQVTDNNEFTLIHNWLPLAGP